MNMNRTLLCLLALLPLLGCKSNNSASGITITPTPTTQTTTTTTNVKRIVSVGAGLNFNAQTGSWSEMAMNPTTSMPGVVYYDRSATVGAVAGALKFASMDAQGHWQVEVVDANTGSAACGSATAFCIGAPNVAVPTASQPQIYDVKFLSTGLPVIVYAYGTTTNKSLRLAEKASDGTWTVSTILTSAQLTSLSTTGFVTSVLEYSIKGIRLLVDSSDRLHLYFGIYAATTVTNSRFAYLMRKADDTWTTVTEVSSATPSTMAAASFVGAGVTFAAGTGVTQIGAAWCKYNNGTAVDQSTNGLGAVLSVGFTDNTPVASTQGVILKCSAVDSDGACTTWNGLDFHAGCAGSAPCVTTTPAFGTSSNAFARSDLAIDPLTGKIFLSSYYAAPSLTAPVTAATGIVSTHSPLTCDSTLTTAAWATVRAHPTAGQGTLGLKVGTDGSNVYMASLTAATGTSYVVNKASLTSGLMTANWAATDQVTVEATTNTIGGGFLVDSTTSLIWGSYGALTAGAAGAVGQDLKVYNTYPADISSTTGFVNNQYVDQTNFVYQTTAVPQLDAAMAPNGTIGYAYYYQEAGTAGPNSHLYYGIRGGTSLAPAFGEKLVSNSINGATTFTNGSHPSLTYNSESNPVISFLDLGVAANAGYLMLATSSNSGTSFSLDRVDGSAVTTNKVGQYSSVKISSSGTTGISYYDFSTGATGQRLKFAKKLKTGGWRRYVVDGPGSAGTNGCTTTATSTTGVYSQFLWSSGGKPVIVYQSAASGVKSLRLAYATESEDSATYTWTCLTLDTTSQATNVRGEGIDFTLDSSDKPHIVHFDQGVGAMRYVSCPNQSDVMTCAAAGATAFSGERLNYFTGSITSISSKPSVRVDSSGKVFVAFYSAADQGLYIASKSAGTSGGWDATAEALELPTSGVTYTSSAGQHAVMNLNSSGQPLIFYRSLENWLKYYSREIY